MNIKEIMDNAKAFYETKQKQEEVNIAFRDLGEFQSWKFLVSRNERSILTVFSIRSHVGEDNTIWLQDVEGDYCYSSKELNFIEKKVTEILNHRIQLTI